MEKFLIFLAAGWPPGIALVISTSSSEGEPRRVMPNDANLDAAASASNHHLPLLPGDLWREGLVGRPLGTNEFTLSADSLIRIHGPQVMAGYGGGDGWLATGDLGKIDEKGRLTVSDRADDMLISGGCNIHPLAVESCLVGCLGIHDVAVASDTTSEGIHAWCLTRLSGQIPGARGNGLAGPTRRGTKRLVQRRLRHHEGRW